MKYLVLALVLLSCLVLLINGLQLNNVASITKLNPTKIATSAFLSVILSGLISLPLSSVDRFKVHAAESVFVGKYSDSFHPGWYELI